jgi:molybdopterin/thiamine biosynthesis adenylyltransferase
MGEMNFWRQMDLVTQADLEKYPVTIIGVGGIGSPTALVLSKMGVKNITVYDDDVVEDHNLPNQMYRISDLGKSKVDGTKDICNDFAGSEIITCNEKFEEQPISGIVISGVDSMKSRDLIWKRLRYNPAVPIYIDARMGAEVCRIMTVNPVNLDDIRWYEPTIIPDDKASDEPCTAKSIIYNTFMIAALIASQVKKQARAQSFAREIIFDLKTLTLINDQKSD